MNSAVRKHPFGYGAIAILTIGLLLVTLLHTMFPTERHRRLVWFPDTTGAGLHAEWRTVPAREDVTAQIAMYLEEMVLGPVELGAIRIVPRGTEMRAVILAEDGTLYIDFDGTILMDDADATGSIDERIAVLSRNILHNFRFVRGIIVTIEGQVPNQPRFARLGR